MWLRTSSWESRAASFKQRQRVFVTHIDERLWVGCQVRQKLKTKIFETLPGGVRWLPIIESVGGSKAGSRWQRQVIKRVDHSGKGWDLTASQKWYEMNLYYPSAYDQRRELESRVIFFSSKLASINVAMPEPGLTTATSPIMWHCWLIPISIIKGNK